MRVPLFDTATPLAPLRAELDAAIAAVLDDKRFILGPTSGVRGRVRVYRGGAPRDRGGQRHGCDHDRPAGHGRGTRRRGRRPVVHVLRVAPRRSRRRRAAGVLRRRSRDHVRLRGDGSRRADPAHEGRARGGPVRQRGAGRRDRSAGRARPRGRRAGRRLHRRRCVRAGALGTAATFSFFPSKNLGASARRRVVVTDDEIADRVRMLRFHGSTDKGTYEYVGYNSRLDELQAAILRVQLPAPRRLGRGPARRRRPLRGGRAGRARRWRCRRPAASPRGISTWSLTRRRTRSTERLAARGDRPKAYYRDPGAPPAGDARTRRGRRLPVTDELAADPPGDPDERRAHHRAGGRRRRRGPRRPRRPDLIRAAGRSRRSGG